MPSEKKYLVFFPQQSEKELLVIQNRLYYNYNLHIQSQHSQTNQSLHKNYKSKIISKNNVMMKLPVKCLLLSYQILSMATPKESSNRSLSVTITPRQRKNQNRNRVGFLWSQKMHCRLDLQRYLPQPRGTPQH